VSYNYTSDGSFSKIIEVVTAEPRGGLFEMSACDSNARPRWPYSSRVLEFFEAIKGHQSLTGPNYPPKPVLKDGSEYISRQ
jgi:hypothetical protein